MPPPIIFRNTMLVFEVTIKCNVLLCHFKQKHETFSPHISPLFSKCFSKILVIPTHVTLFIFFLSRCQWAWHTAEAEL